MTAPAAVLASFVKLSTLSDGTVRAVIDIEPKDRAAAFALFDAPGSPVAVARLKNEAAVAHDRRQQEPAERKPLSLASKVALTCKQPTFQEYMHKRDPYLWAALTGRSPEEKAAATVREICQVSSRSEITEGSPAAERWLSLEADYLAWQRGAAQ